MKEYPISELVFDFDLYPRGKVDSTHASEIAGAIEAGAELPPLVIDKKSKRVIDGFHRGRAYIRLHGPDHKTLCIEKTYKSESDMFVDAMRYNASHGRALSQHDKAHCLLIAQRFKIDAGTVANALNITPARIEQLTTERMGRVAAAPVKGKPRTQPVALKATIRHMAGKKLTQPQAEANNKLSGMNQAFYANQLIALLENNLIDASNDNVTQALDKLYELLGAYLETVKAA